MSNPKSRTVTICTRAAEQRAGRMGAPNPAAALRPRQARPVPAAAGG
ncbi:MAG: hypothetical protein JW810_11995 [Sedimentisphaerales bacterium]|nr:hypothetical protein [Sedimentisphaerales bacterium]